MKPYLNNKIDRSKPPISHTLPVIKFIEPFFIKLKNGLRVLIIKNPKFPIINVSLEFDKPLFIEGEKAGIQNMINSMLRSGTKNYTKKQIDYEIDKIALDLKIDSYGVYLSTLKRYFKKSMELTHEIMFNSTFDDQNGFNRSLKQLISSNIMSEKNPEIVMDRVKRVLFYGKNHPYGEYCTIKTLKNIKISDLKQFYFKHFASPKKSYLIFTGDVSINAVQEILEKYFSSWKNKKYSDKCNKKKTFFALPKKEIQHKKRRIALINFPYFNQSNICIGGLIEFNKLSANYFHAILANDILGVGIQGRLSQNFRENKGVTYGAYSRIESNRDKSLSCFYASTQVRIDVTMTIIDEFMNEIKKISNFSVSEDEINIKKKEIFGRFLLSMEDNRTYTGLIVNELIENLPKGFYKKYIYNINKVTSLDVMNFCKQNLIVDNFWIIIMCDIKKVIPYINIKKYSIDILDVYGNFIEKI